MVGGKECSFKMSKMITHSPDSSTKKKASKATATEEEIKPKIRIKLKAFDHKVILQDYFEKNVLTWLKNN